MRIGIASLALEANTFNPAPTILADFRSGVFLSGAEIWRLRDSHHELGGFLSQLALTAGVEVVPLFVAAAAPGGILTASTFDDLRSRLHAQMDRAGALDGLLLAPHGAMVAEYAFDADGAWLAEMRKRVGSQVPIVATIDPHANLSSRMIMATDAIIAYKTNPHVDQRERGMEAARLIVRAVAEEIRLQQSACFPPLAIEIERQDSSTGVCAELLQVSRTQETLPGVLSSSIVLGFPYADVPELGTAAIVVTDGNVAESRPLADSLGNAIWDRRFDLTSRLVSSAEAIRQCCEFSETTCLLDMGDNVGGGSPGDSTVLFHEILAQRAGPGLGVLIDAQAAAQAATAGIGASLLMPLGGRLPATPEKPLMCEFQVIALSDGRFSETEPRHGGQQQFDQGLSAVLKNDQLTIIAISRRVPPFSLRQITHLGVDPTHYRLIVAKGVHAPMAAYGSVCSKFTRVNTPGITATTMANFEYEHRRRPLFPCEPNHVWKP